MVEGLNRQKVTLIFHSRSSCYPGKRLELPEPREAQRKGPIELGLTPLMRGTIQLLLML